MVGRVLLKNSYNVDSQDTVVICIAKFDKHLSDDV